MIYLNPPYYIIDGITLLPDHLDQHQYYFMPITPHLTTTLDAQSGKEIPNIQLIKYRGQADNGGFLSFNVNLGVAQSLLEEVRGKLKSTAKLSKPPRLAPLPLVDGSVKMMLFGAQTGVAPGPGIEPKFVLKINHHVKPSLYGDNQAAFSVQLDQYGITMLEKALQGEMSPIGIVYSLEFLALRPAYSVRLNIDWNRVQNHLEEKFSTQLFASSVSIDKAIDDLIEKRVILLEADTFDDSSEIKLKMDQAINEVRDMVTDAFFQPTIHPINLEKDGLDRTTEVGRRVLLASITGGGSEIFGFSYKKVDHTRIDMKSLNVNISERTTVKRSIFPQGHLMGLCRVLKQEGLNPADFMIDVDIDDKWFQRRRIEVQTNANFAEDSIGSINVKMRYGNEPKNAILDMSTPKKSFNWGSIIKDGNMQWELPYSYEIIFNNVDSTERPVKLTSPQSKTTLEGLVITPRELYSMVSVNILALTPFPWKRYSAVEVHTRYKDEANGIHLNDTFLLKDQQAEHTWKMFVINPQLKRFEYKLVYRAVNNKDITMSWVVTDEEQVIVRDPYPMKRTLKVVPSFNWEDVDRAFVDLTYEDKANQILESESFEFSAGDNATKTFSVDLRNVDLRLVAYQLIVLFKDGITYEVPRSFTNANRIILHKNLRGHRIVTVRPDVVNFAKRKAKRLKVEIRYEDAMNDLSFSDSFSFDEKTLNGVGYFEYDFVEKPHYEYRVWVWFQSGTPRVSEWLKSNVDELLVPVS